MKQKTNTAIFPALIFSLFLVACNQETKTDEPAKAETSQKDMPAYNPDLDPVKVEAAFIKVLADTLGVKLFEGVYQPGDSVALHTHPDNIIYVLEGTNVEIFNEDGTSQTVAFKTGMGLVLGPVTHRAKIIGPTPLRLVVADIYRPRN